MRHTLLTLLLISTSLSLPLQADTALDKDALFRILAAEFAIYRNQFNQAQHFYLAEARQQKDAALAERATRLSLHNQHYVDMLEAALIWQKADPADTNALFFTALAYGYNSQPNLALDFMQRVLRNKGETDFVQLVNLLPNNAASQQLYLNALFQMLNEHPKNVDVSLALAIIHSRAGNPQQALNYADKAVALAPANPQVLDYSVRIYTRHQQPQKALDVYRKAIRQHPDNIQLRQMMIQLAMRHDPAEARQQLMHLLQQSPDDDYLLLNLALVNMELQHTEDATQQLQQLRALQKRSSAAHYYLGLIARHNGDIDNALAAFFAVTEGREYPLAQEHIARIYMDQQLYSEAISRINQQLGKTDDNEQRERLFLLKARALEKQGHIDQAYLLLTTLLDDNPDSIDLRYSRAMLAETGNQLPQMESDLRHILQLQPDSAMALNALGYTLANRTDRYREALQLIEQAHQLVPDDPAILDSMGWVLYRLGRLQEALTYLKKAMKLYPDAEVAAHLAEVLWVSGQKNEARKVLREALENEPDNPILNETVQRLNVPL